MLQYCFNSEGNICNKPDRIQSVYNHKMSHTIPIIGSVSVCKVLHDFQDLTSLLLAETRKSTRSVQKLCAVEKNVLYQ